MTRQNHLVLRLLTLSFLISIAFIDTSEAGVTLVEDVSIKIDGVEKISNGDFSEGQIHWSRWDDDPLSTRDINTDHYVSPDASYQVGFKVDWWGLMSTRTFYDTSPVTQQFDGPPYYPGSSIWIPASPGQEVSISFMYKGKMGPSFILCLRDSGEWFNLVNQRHWGSWEWTYVVMTATVPPDGTSIGFQFDVGFDDHGPSVDLEPNIVSADHKDTLSITAHIMNSDPGIQNPVDLHVFAVSPSGCISVVERVQGIELTADYDIKVVVFEHLFRNRERGNYDFIAAIKNGGAGHYFPSIGYCPFSIENW